MDPDYRLRLIEFLQFHYGTEKPLCIYGLDHLLKERLNSSLSRLEYYQISGERPVQSNKAFRILEPSTIADNLTLVSINGGNSILVPKEIDKSLAYAIGWLYGDGGISVSSRGKKKSFQIHLTNKSKNDIVKVIDILNNKFKINMAIHKYGTRNIYSAYKNSILLAKYLHKVFDMPLGKKTGKLKFPQILKSNIEKSNWFIAGFFEADGSLFFKADKPVLSMRQSSLCLLLEIQRILGHQEIEFRGPYLNKSDNCFEIVCKKKESIKKFYKIIPVSKKIAPVV